MATTYISLIEAANLARDATQERLVKANAAVRNFATMHPGEPIPHDLQAELDEAWRVFEKAARDLKELGTTASPQQF
jgi:hypothetical protein